MNDDLLKGMKLIPENETLRQKIDRLESGNGGWTKAALKELDVPWPPPKGWRKRLLKDADSTQPEN